ncbi:MAG: hypothetical protein V3T83_07340 [Acidobacteriota bacterium]
MKEIPPQWLAEFEAAANRPLKTRFRYAFIRTYKPVLDDEPFRAFDTMAEYRRAGARKTCRIGWAMGLLKNNFPNFAPRFGSDSAWLD